MANLENRERESVKKEELDPSAEKEQFVPGPQGETEAGTSPEPREGQSPESEESGRRREKKPSGEESEGAE